MRLVAVLALVACLALAVAPIQRVRCDEVEEIEDVVAQADGGDEDYYDDEPEEEYEAPLVAHNAVDVHYIFPKTGETRFPIGEYVEMLIGVANNHPQNEFNLTSAQLFLVSPQDYHYYVENYTRADYHQILASGEQTTLFYRFFPHDGFDPQTFGLSAVLDYSDVDGHKYRSVVYNSTIELTEPKDYVDAGTFYMYTAALGVIILVATVVYRMQNSKTGGKRRTRRQERGTEDSNDLTERDLEFIEGLTPEKKKKPRSPKSPKSPKKAR